ncbi:uncharacterized protein LOC129756297 [Uranotaenia lowii]|uniref:uncharacterized protein LOC129756297 n=1 Tax=Uranotaenia lowii TaxID=190385 RepID=UPI0024792894|nr:uncharacterized protein LOC129756297 [Uranotaenia lowii]
MTSPRDSLTFFDPSTRIWSGIKSPYQHDPNQSLGKLILDSLAKTPAKVTQISVDSGVQITCGEMRNRTIRLAQNLTELGYGPGDIFTMAARNGEHVAPVLFASLALGVPINTLDPSFRRDDFSHMLSTVKPRLVFCDQETLPEMEVALGMIALKPELVILGQKVEGYRHITDLLKPTGREETFVPTRFEDPSKQLAIIVCSSGTTGRSKGVCLSHSLCIAHFIGVMGCYPPDILLCFSSLYWLSGVVFLLLGTVTGAVRVITRELFNPDLAFDIIEKYRVTLCFFAPAIVLQLVNHPRALKANFSSVRACMSGGASVTAAMKYSFEKLAPNCDFKIGYGMSEIGGVVSMTEKNYYKEGSTGYIHPNVEVKVVDDSGNAVDINQEGEILIKPQFYFLGYYGNKEATDEILDQNGWIHSGDIGRIDKDGYLYIVDRKKDIIKYLSYQISPTEIETIIQSIPGVVNVCVAGVPVPGSDLPAALVVKSKDMSLTEESIDRVVRQKLSDYKQLRGGIHLVESLPMTPSGKVMRRSCRDIMEEFYTKQNDVIKR